MTKPQYFVWREDINRKSIEQFNVLTDDLLDVFKKHKETLVEKSLVAEEFKKDLMYKYWARAEHEVVITSWPPFVTEQEIARLVSETETRKFARYAYTCRLTCATKIDIYEQIMLNYPIFIDYLWEATK